MIEVLKCVDFCFAKNAGFHDPTDKWQGHEVLPLYVRLYVLK
jgi:hypothetical protein